MFCVYKTLRAKFLCLEAELEQSGFTHPNVKETPVTAAQQGSGISGWRMSSTFFALPASLPSPCHVQDLCFWELCPQGPAFSLHQWSLQVPMQRPNRISEVGSGKVAVETLRTGTPMSSRHLCVSFQSKCLPLAVHSAPKTGIINYWIYYVDCCYFKLLHLKHYDFPEGRWAVI